MKNSAAERKFLETYRQNDQLRKKKLSNIYTCTIHI